MAPEHALRHYRRWYAKLLCLYPQPFRLRFAEAMEQTFSDLCRERIEAGQGLFRLMLWIFCETSVGIMKENVTSILIKHKSVVRILVATALILMVPLVAMRFSDEMNWTAFDFVVAGTLLIGSGLTFDFVARKSRNFSYQLGLGFAIITGVLLIWVNLAVGLIGSEEHPANLMYFAVLLLGFIGAIGTGFRPRGMLYVMLATAIAQTLVPLIALLIWQPPLTIGVLKTIVVSSLFAVLFAVSALLFRRASRDAVQLQSVA